MKKRSITHKVRILRIGLIVIVLMSVAVFAKTFVAFDITYREILFGIIACVIALVLFKGKRGIEFGFACAVWTMALGYRTIDVGNSISLHPAELLLWGLVLFVLIERALIGQQFGPLSLPWWVPVMMGFCIWGWFPNAPQSITWNMQFVQFKVFLLLIPFFMLASALLRSKGMWNRVIASVLLAGVWVAAVGALEFFVPATRGYLKGLIVETAPLLGEEGFLRAPFSFWGSPDAAYVCMVATPLVPLVWSTTSNKVVRFLVSLAGFVLLIGIYISGHRSAWLLLLLVAGLWVLLRKGVLWGMLAVVVGFLALEVAANLLPQEAAERFQSGIQVFEGKSSDSSGKKRWARAEQSLQSIGKHPFGRGWACAGWVHCDFLMVTENLGMPGGLFFLAAYCVTLVRLLSAARSRAPSSYDRKIGVSLFLSMLVAGWLLAFESTLVLTQLALPVWSAWVLGETWVRQQSTQAMRSHEQANRLRPDPDVQFIGDTAGHARISEMGR